MSEEIKVHESAENDYMLGMKYDEIAKKYNVSINTVKSWKQRYKWNRKSVHTNSKSMHTKKEPQKIDAELIEENSELNERQKLFCLYYIKNFNATQAAIKAGYSQNTAYSIGYNLLKNIEVRKEIDRLKEMKRQSIMLDENDIVERYMRIAFSDLTDFVEFGQEEIPVMSMFGPVMMKNESTGEEEVVTKIVNTVKFKNSEFVDGGLITQIKQGKDGASIKLEDRQKALEWLANYFNINPMNKHKQEFDKRKLEIELLKAEAQINKANDNAETITPGDDGFMDALNSTAGEVWNDDDVGKD